MKKIAYIKSIKYSEFFYSERNDGVPMQESNWEEAEIGKSGVTSIEYQSNLGVPFIRIYKENGFTDVFKPLEIEWEYKND